MALRKLEVRLDGMARRANGATLLSGQKVLWPGAPAIAPLFHAAVLHWSRDENEDLSQRKTANVPSGCSR